jgi:hypothetical protein
VKHVVLRDDEHLAGEVGQISSSAAVRCESAAVTTTGTSSYSRMTCRPAVSIGRRTRAASTCSSASRCPRTSIGSRISRVCGIRTFQMSIHLPGVAPGTAPSVNVSAGGGRIGSGFGAFGRGLAFVGLPGFPAAGLRPFAGPPGARLPGRTPLRTSHASKGSRRGVPVPASLAPLVVSALIVAALAALLHVYIWVMESITWRQPETWKRFGVKDQDAADAVQPMAFNQGF